MKRSIPTLLAAFVISAAIPVVSHADNTTPSFPTMPGAQGSGGFSGQHAGQMMQRFQQMRQQEQEKFKSADKDGNGSLSKEEAQQGMPQLAKNFDKIDANHDGQVSPDEIKQYYQSRMSSMQSRFSGMRGQMQQHSPVQQAPAN